MRTLGFKCSHQSTFSILRPKFLRWKCIQDHGSTMRTIIRISLYYRSMPRLRDIWKVSLQRAKGTCSTSVSCDAWVISFLSHVLQLGILKLFWEGKRKGCKFSNFAKTLILCLITSQLIFTCWKSTTETLEKGVKYVQS